jgi:hypothetical protein
MTRALGTVLDILRISSFLLLLPASVAAQTVTTQGVDRTGDLTLKISQSGLEPGTVVPYTVYYGVSMAFQCVRKGQVVPVDIGLDITDFIEEWTAVAKPTGVVRTAVTLFLPGGGAGLCTTGWTAEVTWVRYYDLAISAAAGPLVPLNTYERRLR